MSADIEVFYYSGGHTRTLLPQSAALLDRLPAERRDRILRRAHVEQQASELATLRLLEIAMESRGVKAFRLADVEFGLPGRNQKPTWSGGTMDFSLTHTATAVACAISVRGRVGLDMEERRMMEPRVVTRLLNDTASLRDGLSEHNAVERWTQIEAVVKAAGVGIARAHEIIWRNESAVLTGKNWWLHRVDCGPKHWVHAASDVDRAVVSVTRIDAL